MASNADNNTDDKKNTPHQAPVMLPTHKNLLVQMGPVLIKDLQVEHIIPDMVDRGILSERNAEKVMAHKTEKDQAFEFLCILPKCGPDAFDTFVEVLRKHKKKKLADSLAKKATASSSKNQIANFYIDHMSQIQRLPWDPDDTMHLDDVYVNLQWVQYKRKPAVTSSNPIHMYTSMFKEIKQRKTPKRILVKGKAGIGKTTFTQKMATDWANATLGLGECDGLLSKYKHLLILNLRSIQPGQTLKEAMETQIACSAENRKAVTDEVMQALQYDTDHVLLAFDGYDEYDINTSKEITDIIYRRRYPDVCTVITTRPWKAEELMNRRITDGAYEITGLTEDNIHEYVAKFFEDQETYDEYRKLKSGFGSCSKRRDVLKSIGKGLVGYIMEKKDLMSLVKVPILLLFICLMWEDDQKSGAKTDSLPGSYTLLYRKLIDLVIRRTYQISTQDEMQESTRVKNLEEQTFISLGKLAFDGLLKPEGGLIFNKRDLQSIPEIKELYILGLLSKSKVHRNQDVKDEIEFPHKTIQEFFAANYLARTLDKNDNEILDNFLKTLETLDEVYNMEFVLGFLCGLTERAAVKVLKTAKALQGASEKREYYSLEQNVKVFGWEYDKKYSQWCNDLLLEHWYAHCPQETVLPPELISWHTALHTRESFQHSDPRFQQVLHNSVNSAFSNPQTYSGVAKDVRAVILYNAPASIVEQEHKFLSLLNTCDMFQELEAIVWDTEHTCGDCESVLNEVLSKAPNLDTLVIGGYFSGILSSIPNPRKLVLLELRGIHFNDQDVQVIEQISSLEYIFVSSKVYEPVLQDLQSALGTLSYTSRNLTKIKFDNVCLGAYGVKLLGENLQYVPGLELLFLDEVFNGGRSSLGHIPRCGPRRHTWPRGISTEIQGSSCLCPEGKDTTDYDRCQDVCEAVRELSQGVIHTTKLKDFSFRDNHLGQYHGISSPLIVLVQSLSTVSEQIGMWINMGGNDLGRVDRLSELIKAIVSSYQYVSYWDMKDNNLKDSLPQPDDSLKCQVSLTW